MSKQQLNATELVNTEVNFVSLVKRGANRIPFRITKEDQNMIDLHKIGRAIFKMAEPKLDVIGAIVQKSADIDKVNAVLKSAGLDPETLVKSEHDGVVTLTKADNLESGSVLKVSDEVALVVNTDLKKTFNGIDLGSWSFGEVLATEGYFVGVCTAVDVLKSTVANILMEATSAAEAASAVGKASDEMKAYLVTLTGGLPVQAFKADAEFAKAGSLEKADAPAESAEPAIKADEQVEAKKEEDVKAEKAEESEATVEKAEEVVTDTVTKENVNPMDNHESSESSDSKKKKKAESSDEKNAEADDKAKAKEPAKKEEDAVADVEKAASKELDDSESGAGAEKPKDAPVVKADHAVVLEAIAELRKSVEDEISGVKKSVSDISDRVEQVSKLAKKTDADLNGTVFNDAGGDVTRTQKSDGAIPLLDTAYSRRTA